MYPTGAGLHRSTFAMSVWLSPLAILAGASSEQKALSPGNRPSETCAIELSPFKRIASIELLPL